MDYQVTARKWRPQTFDDVVEQQHVIRTLKNATFAPKASRGFESHPLR